MCCVSLLLECSFLAGSLPRSHLPSICCSREQARCRGTRFPARSPARRSSSRSTSSCRPCPDGELLFLGLTRRSGLACRAVLLVPAGFQSGPQPRSLTRWVGLPILTCSYRAEFHLVDAKGVKFDHHHRAWVDVLIEAPKLSKAEFIAQVRFPTRSPSFSFFFPGRHTALPTFPTWLLTPGCFVAVAACSCRRGCRTLTFAPRSSTCSLLPRRGYTQCFKRICQPFLL